MKLKLKGKLLLINIVLLCLLTTTIIFTTNMMISKIVVRDKMNSISKLGFSLLNERYSGYWQEKSGKLYKGWNLLSDSSAIFDKIKEDTGAYSTIYLGNKSVATSMRKKDNNRLIGNTVNENIANDVLKDGKEYIGEMTLLGKKLYVKYIPIKSKQGKVIGMFGTGIDKGIVEKELNKLTLQIIILTIVIVVIASIIYYFFIKRITNRMKKIEGVIKEVEKGNLDVQCNIKTDDELGHISKGLNNMLDSIKGLIKDVKTSGEIVSNSSISLSDITEDTKLGANEVAKTMDEIARSISEQANETEKGVTNAVELSGSIDEIATSINDMGNIFESLEKRNKRSLEIVNILTKKSTERNEASKNVRNVMTEVNDSSNNIGVITETINSIAEQTQLLALNASIEAARAGDAGKGFSVVAEEIRKLAQETNDATDKIGDLISNMQSKSESAVNLMEINKEISKEQDETVIETKNIFNSIYEGINEIKNRINNIETLNTDMKSKKDKLVSSIEGISAISEETSASTEEVSASTQQQLAAMEEVNGYCDKLRDLAKELKGKIDKFNI